MRNRVFGLVSLAGIMLLTGCVESEMVVNIEKDGSGTIEQKVVALGKI